MSEENVFIIEGDSVFILHRTGSLKRVLHDLKRKGLTFKEQTVYCG